MEETEFEDKLIENGFKKISYWEYESKENIIRINRDSNTFEIETKKEYIKNIEESFFEKEIPYSDIDIKKTLDFILNAYLRNKV